jgi:hypothetical protein
MEKYKEKQREFIDQYIQHQQIEDEESISKYEADYTYDDDYSYTDDAEYWFPVLDDIVWMNNSPHIVIDCSNMPEYTVKSLYDDFKTTTNYTAFIKPDPRDLAQWRILNQK